MSPDRSKERPAGSANTLHMDGSLTPHEDADLRRLGALSRYASAAPLLLGRYEELRARDRRITVRDVSNSELIRVVWDHEDSE